VSVYKLRGGQHGYRENVINFAQDIREFTTHLPRHSSSLDIFIIRRQSANDPTKFKNFTVRHAKVARALLWLKKNNCYYCDIIIDDNILQSLPENDSVIDQLRQFQDARITDEDLNEDESRDNTIMHNFISSPPPTNREDVAINNTLNCMQTENPPVIWPEIDGNSINEFQTPGYSV
jgi:hypothetical protein